MAHNSATFIATNANKYIYHILQQNFKLKLGHDLDKQYKEPGLTGGNHRDDGPWPHSRAFKLPERDAEAGGPVDMKLRTTLGKLRDGFPLTGRSYFTMSDTGWNISAYPWTRHGTGLGVDRYCIPKRIKQ